MERPLPCLSPVAFALFRRPHGSVRAQPCPPKFVCARGQAEERKYTPRETPTRKSRNLYRRKTRE